ncbi:MAG: hypothetical protein MR914_06575 [Clostridiales bacterium]|nr:hypothetical protein [Clostridiales bacterium]
MDYLRKRSRQSVLYLRTQPSPAAHVPRPARQESIPVHVRSSFLPQAGGTWIT